MSAAAIAHLTAMRPSNQRAHAAEKAASAEIYDFAAAFGFERGCLGEGMIMGHHRPPFAELTITLAACLIAARMRG